MRDLVATMPVAVILNPEAGLLGAAVHADRRPPPTTDRGASRAAHRTVVILRFAEEVPVHVRCARILAVLCVALRRSAPAASAQQTGSISGKVVDTGGGVLPA